MGWMEGPEEVANSLKLAPSGWQRLSGRSMRNQELWRMSYGGSSVSYKEPIGVDVEEALPVTLVDCGTRAVTVAGVIVR